jgi:hypothetical protein
MKDIVQRERQCLVHMTTDGQTELANIDIGRDHRPVPADIELIVGGDYTFVEDLKWRLQRRRPGPLQDHRPFLRKGLGLFQIKVTAPDFLAITTPTTCRILGKKILRFMFRHRRYSVFFELRADLAWVARSMSGGGCCSPAIAHQTPT